MGEQEIKFDRKCMSTMEIYERGKSTQWKVEGFWASDEEVKCAFGFPFPKSSKDRWSVQQKEDFISKLKKLETCPLVRKLYADGLSPSRMEKGKLLGSTEFRLEGKIAWPGDFVDHYVDKHNVLPSQEFYDLVMKCANIMETYGC